LSPHRWFFISSVGYNKFETFFNYNFGILYLEKEKIIQRKIRRIWINSPITLYEVIGSFISFYPMGLVTAKFVPVHFIDDPVEIDISLTKGDYFICFLISYNNYSTSYEGADIKSGNINLVETLLEFVNSPYEILPFLFPFMVKMEDLKKLVYHFTVSKEIFRKISTRISKFGAPQDPNVVSFYESLLQESNRLLNIVEEDRYYHIEVANPVLIPFLLKKFAFTQSNRVKSYVENALSMSKALDKIRYLDELLKGEKFFVPEFLILQGIGRSLARKAEILEKYIHIVKESLSTLNKY